MDRAASRVNRSPGIVVQLRYLPAVRVFYATARNKAAECRFRGCCWPRDHLYRPINFRSRPFQRPRVEPATIYARYGERRDIPAPCTTVIPFFHPAIFYRSLPNSAIARILLLRPSSCISLSTKILHDSLSHFCTGLSNI